MIAERYSVEDFNPKGRNIYMDAKSHFFIDTINTDTNELDICMYNEEHELIRVINTGFLFKDTIYNEYPRRNEMIGLYSDGDLLYVYYTGYMYKKKDIAYVHIFDVQTGKRNNGIALQDIGSGNILSITYRWGYYFEPLWDDGSVIYQIKLDVIDDRILLDGYYRANVSDTISSHTFYIFNMRGEQVLIGHTRGYEDGKEVYPIAFNEEGGIEQGIPLEYKLEAAANMIGYSFKEGFSTLQRCFRASDMIIEDDALWLSKYIYRIGSDSFNLMNYEPAIFGFKKQDGDWKFTEFINFLNFPELRYNIFIDRILRAEGDKLWLWVRVGHNLTESYEKRYFDREIWVIEESDN